MRRIKNGVAEHYRFAKGTGCAEELIARPEAPLLLLQAEVDAGLQASMDIDRMFILPKEWKAPEESEMIRWDRGGVRLRAGQGRYAIACQCLFATGLKKEAVILPVQVPEKEILMVAHEGDRPGM